MRRNLKKFGCAILCTCLLMINAPAPMSYAGSTEQYASETDAAEADVTNTDVPDIKAALRTATDTDAEDINNVSVTETDALFAASFDMPEGGYKLEINSQTDWDNLFTHTVDDGSGWSSAGSTATYNESKNPVVIILNDDITLSGDTTLSIPPIADVDGAPVAKDFFLYGNGHSIKANNHKFVVQNANTVAMNDVHIKEGTVQVYGHISFNCADCHFTNASVELYTNAVTETTYITGCEFLDCPNPCVYSKNAPCPVSFSGCTMDSCGLLFVSQNQCKASFSGITAENCTGPVLGQTTNGGYIIESISGCELSTSTPGITAIEHQIGAVKEITDCTITGFDTGISLTNCYAAPAYDIDTITIKDTEITDCITGLCTNNLNGYQNAIILNLTMQAREGVSDTIGYKAEGNLTTNTFSSSDVNYDFDKMPQIKSCNITGFDTGISFNGCYAVVSDCQIADCIMGISITRNIVAIADTTLKSRASLPESSDNAGVTTDTYGICWLVDCDINDFYVGSDMSVSSNTTIIGCRYQNNTTNLIGANYTTSVYNTSFIGGETSVILKRGTSYFYGCVVEGAPAVTKSGFSMEAGASNLHIYSQDRPYLSPQSGNDYDMIKKNSDRTVTNGKSEIFNCETGIDAKSSVYFADTHVHNCETGINLTSGNDYSYGNNFIEDCTDGVIVSGLHKDKGPGGNSSMFTDIYTDTIRRCSNNGLTIRYITGSSEWDNRLEIYDCDNYGINVIGSITPVAIDVHDCGTGIYLSDTSSSVILGNETKIYNSLEWNVYDNNTSGQFIIQGQDGTLTGGKLGNIYSKKQAIISVTDLYSNDSVYYLGTADLMYNFSVGNLHGTAVFDTIDGGYLPGRRIASLTADITSQMFAKKEGYIIVLKEEGSNKYAVFAEGCNVTYDVTTNGGEAFSRGIESINDEDENINGGNQTYSDNSDESLTRISYLDGSDIDLSYTASKTGYEFVGWNTNPDATEGLDVLTAGRKDITLYAIYKKTAYVNYHTYDAASDYRAAVTFYNNQYEIEHELAAYNAGGFNTFTGYVLDEDAAISSADDVITEGSDVTVSPDGLDVYCVYKKQGQLDYLKKDGSTLSTERSTVYQISSDSKNFVYTIKAGAPVEGFTFKEWKDGAGNSYAAGSTLSTKNSSVVLKPVYVVYEEPSTEEPTTDTPTTEAPTTDTPTTEKPDPEAPVIEPPAKKEPAGPKTGDSAAPIAVTILGLLSLLGFVGLSMKDRRKN